MRGMKGTNPETQGHRWAKRVKKRLKRERIEEGQWEELEQRKWDAFNAEREAKEAGCTQASGLDMFVGQAARQFELFTGKEAARDLMREAVLDGA